MRHPNPLSRHQSDSWAKMAAYHFVRGFEIVHWEGSVGYVGQSPRRKAFVVIQEEEPKNVANMVSSAASRQPQEG